MKKRMKVVDVLASVALVGVVSTMALGQLGPLPEPLVHWCPPGIKVINNVHYPYSGKWCPVGTGCGTDYWVDENGVWGVFPICTTAQ